MSMDFLARKWIRQKEEVYATEDGFEADGAPLTKLVLACVFKNPYAGEMCDDLSAAVNESEGLGAAFAEILRQECFDEKIVSYGKGAIVGGKGAYEHGNAYLTTVAADPIREAIGGGKAWVPSTGKIGNPG